jgi:tryptophan-rich sensory protein
MAPPNSIFSPVWGVLYILMLVSLILYIKEQKANKLSGYIYFSIQLFLNIIWSPIFFGAESILGGLVVIILLDIFVILTIKKFYNVSKLSAILLIPYLIWILFATYLNIGYLILN